jgi:two-component system, response regulator
MIFTMLNYHPSKTVLLIHDLSGDIILFQRALDERNINCKLISAMSADLASNYLNQPNNEIPDIIFMDFAIVPTGGYELIKQIRTNRKTALIPIIVLVINNEMAHKLEATGLVVNGYITLDLSIDKLAEALHFWIMTNKSPNDKWN